MEPQAAESRVAELLPLLELAPALLIPPRFFVSSLAKQHGLDRNILVKKLGTSQ